MCARFSLFATPDQIAELLDLEVSEVLPRYNIAPTQMLLGAIEKDGERQLREFRWGLVPSWAKDESVGQRMINARSETVLEKPAFRRAFEKRRCVIPASGFFEWKHETVQEEILDDARREAAPSLFEEFDIPRPSKKAKTIKQPYFFSLADGATFGFAGLYEYWRNASGDLLRTCTIITTEPNELIAPFHDRMPVMLRKPELECWLDCASEDLVEAERLLRPLAAQEMRCAAASMAVNDPRNESAAILGCSCRGS
jgi:putative SOS response-associated peptidase YedK